MNRSCVHVIGTDRARSTDWARRRVKLPRRWRRGHVMSWRTVVAARRLCRQIAKSLLSVAAARHWWRCPCGSDWLTGSSRSSACSRPVVGRTASSASVVTTSSVTSRYVTSVSVNASVASAWRQWRAVMRSIIVDKQILVTASRLLIFCPGSYL